MSGKILTSKKVFTVLALSPFMMAGLVAYIICLATITGWQAGMELAAWFIKEEA